MIKPEVVWQGRVCAHDVSASTSGEYRIVLTFDPELAYTAEVCAGKDAMGQERWDTVTDNALNRLVYEQAFNSERNLRLAAQRKLDKLAGKAPCAHEKSITIAHLLTGGNAYWCSKCGAMGEDKITSYAITWKFPAPDVDPELPS